MAEPIEWLADGAPYSPRFGDRYRSETGGGLDQARGVFLQGCGLPAAWAARPHWTILETGFGLGLNFLATWAAWRADPARPARLHFVSVEAHPVSAADLLRSVTVHPALQPLAEELAAQYWGLRPGLHRLRLDQGRVLLTLAIGEAQPLLRELACQADAVFLDGFSPARNPEIWSLDTLKAVARCCRPGTRLATWTVARTVRDSLAQCGFDVRAAPGIPPKRDRLEAVYAPAWTPRLRPSRWQDDGPAATPGRCVVLGAGLAGATVARQLAERGWQVQVLDAADAPAGGASGLPVGLFSPHDAAQDTLPTALSRAGARCTAALLQALLEPGRDYALTGVLERRLRGARPVTEPDDPFSAVADAARLQAAGLPPGTPAQWHAVAGWVRPARLVQALLQHPAIRFRGGCRVARVQATPQGWSLRDAQDHELDEASLLVLASGIGSAALLEQDGLKHVRGQVSWGPCPPTLPVPATPVNGHGHFVAGVPGADGPIWLGGSSFQRDDTGTDLRDADQRFNLERLHLLLPDTARAIAAGPPPSAWAGVRCASPDRLPLAGPWKPPGLWVLTALGARGLTLAPLAAELLAARLHDEPLPVPARLAAALDPRRLRP
ncbi:FAD-dependent 5-carboxymethylaminomethyl-2-thiouridine(34) oxidoreductase MnmC [Pseudorhodoferax sp.]|uniref:FAD-dependent 5-carboxymethylaminomethyl-2-thiouridine(34) oxidoreductase MnmC n=1 Tax=Pseudorhodoferax sp. TaxID=1993553 RepID=UPI002DD6692E|nr:FAD-dependent 5-carboxymethylaminomethyl-2-thiouridine(34) oxidoreductase MnmC [Pseudorhodoferax sp.]